jgi:hypothetical protein
LFNSARRFGAVSTSKTPPQQGQRIADRFDEFFGFGAHGSLLDAGWTLSG